MSVYEVGKWYGWNGDVCPVHQKTEVEIMLECGIKGHGYAEGCAWHNQHPGSKIIAFRVIKEHREAREFWAREMREVYISRGDKRPDRIFWTECREGDDDAVLFREVMPDE